LARLLCLAPCSGIVPLRMANAVAKRVYCPRCSADFWAHLTVSPRGYWCTKCQTKFTAKTDNQQINVIYEIEDSPKNASCYYQLLGINPSASFMEIKTAYRQKANQWHPDRNPQSAEAAGRFREIAEAYSVLIDKEKRSAYDSLTQSTIPKNKANSDAEVQSESEGTQAYANEMILAAIQLKSNGSTWKDVCLKLVHKGCPFELAKHIVMALEEQHKKETRSLASELGKKAIAAICIGLAISIVSANLGSGRYILVFYFPYLYGIANGCRALYYLAISHAP